MSALTDYADRVKGYAQTVNAGVDGLGEDIQSLKDLIAQIQNSPGPISAEDQTALNDAETLLAAAADRVKALDDTTPPVAPPAP